MNSHHDAESRKTEEEEVREFLRTSSEFKMMKNIVANTAGMRDAADFITAIERHLTFDNILYQTQELDPKLTDNIMTYNLGRNKTNAILCCMGFFLVVQILITMHYILEKAFKPI